MIRTLFEIFFKDYINEQIDQRFKENMIERFWEHKNNETARRIEELRKSINTASKESMVGEDTTQADVQPSIDVRRNNAEPELSPEAMQALKKENEMNDLKAKLARSKK